MDVLQMFLFEPLIQEEIEEMLQFLPQEYSQELVGQLGSCFLDKLSLDLRMAVNKQVCMFLLSRVIRASRSCLVSTL